jgi:DNA-binding NtrC family response regulator
MPGEHGFAFADRCHAQRPEIPIVLMTSDGAADVLAEAAHRPFLHLCLKPIADAGLNALLRLARDAAGRKPDRLVLGKSYCGTTPRY